MMIDFTAWGTPPEYAFARALIARLQEDAELAPMVFEEPFDRGDQCQKIGTAARACGACVMVTPGAPAGVWQEERTRVLQVPFSVTILATRQLCANEALTAEAVVACIRARVLGLLCGWMPDGRGLLPEEPILVGCEGFDASAWKDWQNLAGCQVSLMKKMRY